MFKEITTNLKMFELTQYMLGNIIQSDFWHMKRAKLFQNQTNIAIAIVEKVSLVL